MPEEPKEEIKETPEVPVKREEELDEDTKEILKEIEDDKKEVPVEEVPEEKPKEEAPKEEPKEEKKEEVKEEAPERTPRFIPEWKFKVAEKKWGKREADLLEQIGGKAKEAETKEEVKDVSDELTKFAEKHQTDPTLVTELVEIVKKSLPTVTPELPKGFQDKLEKLESENEMRRQEQLFTGEFDKTITPSLKGIPEANHKRIKQLLHTLAFTKQYASVPLSNILRFPEFDELKTATEKGKKTVDKSSGGKAEVTSFENIGAEEIKGMSDAEFDEYSDYMEKKGGSGISIRRNGKPIN